MVHFFLCIGKLRIICYNTFVNNLKLIYLSRGGDMRKPKSVIGTSKFINLKQ